MSALPVANFQDLSAVLSLLAADTVEKKLSTETSHDWEKMTCVWSTFGIVGALRFNLKVAVGLAPSERAGVDLCGAAGYTSQPTINAMAYWEIGQENHENPKDSQVFWRDPINQLLSRLHPRSTGIIHPIFIVIGHSRCPFDIHQLRCIQELVYPCLWALLSISLVLSPSLILFDDIFHMSTFQHVTMMLQALTGLFAGVIGPLLIHRLNSSGVVHLRDLPLSRLHPITGSFISKGDHIMTSRNRQQTHIIWQNSDPLIRRRSGDLLFFRALCGINSLFILATYLCNYICLSGANTLHQYLWLLSQTIILILRYVLWSFKPVLFVHRQPCLLYIVTSALTDPIPPELPVDRIKASEGPRITTEMTEFAIASGCSKARNSGFPTHLRRKPLMKLAEVATRDILWTNYTTFGEYISDGKPLEELTIIRLTWVFVEELYASQNIILGPNPWAKAGVYLGAALVNGRFIGLTTVHPISHHFSVCQNPSCAARHTRYANQGGITQDGYYVDDLVDGRVLHYFGETEDSLIESHRMYRLAVELCRSASKENGPDIVEVHASTFGPVPKERVDITLAEANLNMGHAHAAVLNAQTKKHNRCSRVSFCDIPSFENDYIWPAQTFSHNTLHSQR